ncbi:MAG: ComEA family DNA-binding protein [Planctomycetota bacterium]
MPPDETAETLLPLRSQRVIAALLAAGLAAMATWFVVKGGLARGLVHHDAPPPPTGRFSVNVNEAGVDELAVLPGLGPTTAGRIIAHRREHGPFASLDDLLDVPGIGPATLEGLRPHLRPIRRREAAP